MPPLPVTALPALLTPHPPRPATLCFWCLGPEPGTVWAVDAQSRRYVLVRTGGAGSEAHCYGTPAPTL